MRWVGVSGPELGTESRVAVLKSQGLGFGWCGFLLEHKGLRDESLAFGLGWSSGVQDLRVRDEICWV